MKGFEIKICGLTRRSDVDAAVRSGATSLGFIFVPGKRLASKSFAAEIAQAHPALDRVAVVQNLSNDEIFALIQETSVTSLQLHGNETPEFVTRLRAELNFQPRFKSLKKSEINRDDQPAKQSSIRLIRALDVDETLTRERLISWSEVVDVLLFDSPRFGASREHARAPIDVVRLAASLDIRLLKTKFWIAGGLDAQNVEVTLQHLHDRQLHPDGVDVSSGVECFPGMKDPKMLSDFIKNVKRARGESRAT